MRIVISGVVCLLIAGAGAAVIFLTAFFSENPEGVSADQGDVLPAAPVQIEILEPGIVDDVLLLTGRLFAWEEAMVSAETAGAIDWKGVERGDVVSKGQELFHIDVRSIRSTHEQAKARNTLATQNLERARNLVSRGVASQESLEQAQSQYTVAAADLQAAEIQLAKSVVKAPFDGIVDELPREIGEFVDVGTALLRLIQVDPINAAIPVPETDIRFFRVGSKVALSVEALPGEVFEGEIFRVATSADTLTRTFGVEISIANPEGILKPGMTVRARFVRQQFENAITAPLFSIISMENQRFVVVEEAGEAHLRPIQVGRIIGDRVHVTQGLSAGEHLIIAGQRDLREGQPVVVSNETSAL